MSKLTTAEKAKRYDALQAAMAMTKQTYRRERADAESTYYLNPGTQIGAYEKGRADACSRFLDYLERWTGL